MAQFAHRHSLKRLQLSLHDARPDNSTWVAYHTWRVRDTWLGNHDPIPPELEPAAVWQHCQAMDLQLVAESLFSSAKTLECVTLWYNGKECSWTIDREQVPPRLVQNSSGKVAEMKEQGSLYP